MTDTPGITSYSLTTAETLAEMQQDFVAYIAARAQKIAEAAGHNTAEMNKALVDILYQRARQGALHKQGSRDLIDAARGGPDALQTYVAQAKDEPPFSTRQHEHIDQAVAQQIILPAVAATFGDEDRIYLHLAPDTVSDTQIAVKKWLQDRGWDIADYAGNKAIEPATGNIRRIGKMLADEIALRRQFENDPSRTINDVCIVISRRADDIARMSTNRGWWSCMASDDALWLRVPREIEKGSLIAYLIRRRDPEITDPLARILIKPYVRSQGLLPDMARKLGHRFNRDGRAAPPETIHVCGPAFGLTHPVFERTVADFCRDHLNRGQDGVYTLTESLFGGDMPAAVTKKGAQLKPRGLF